ncbi:hypothetical protein [Streptomyces sp. AHA2]|uniref:hypothetical protein n=1 Tax=Streptomyces sp. AHA2 TaxID=3064526 RepID=UPI002FE323FE
MERITAYLRKHVWLQILLSVAVASAAVLLVFPERSPASVVTRMAVSSVGCVVVLLVVRRREQRATGGSVDDLMSLDRKLRRGEVPTDPEERRVMRDLVAQRLHRTRHRVAAMIVLGVMWALFVVLAALTDGPRRTLVMSLLVGALLAWPLVSGQRHHRRLRTMDEKLRRS